MSDDENRSTAGEPEGQEGAGRGWKIAAAIATVAAVGSLGVLGALLLGGAGADGDVRACIVDPASRDFTKDGAAHDRPDDCPPKGAKQVDGLVDKASSGSFTLREIRDGRLEDRVKLYVREPDEPYIDIAHAQTHAALGQPIRVWTLPIDGRDSVVYMEDAPLLG